MAGAFQSCINELEANEGAYLWLGDMVVELKITIKCCFFHPPATASYNLSQFVKDDEHQKKMLSPFCHRREETEINFYSRINNQSTSRSCR